MRQKIFLPLPKWKGAIIPAPQWETHINDDEVGTGTPRFVGEGSRRQLPKIILQIAAKSLICGGGIGGRFVAKLLKV